MSRLRKTISTLATTGMLFHHLAKEQAPEGDPRMAEYFSRINRQINEEYLFNAWFTPYQIRIALQSLAMSLQQRHIENWITPYLHKIASSSPRRVALIPKPTAPMEEFREMATILLTGNTLLLRLVPENKRIIKTVVEFMQAVDPDMGYMINLYEEKLPDFDAVIATRAHNDKGYFKAYLQKYPHWLRHKLPGIAVLSGNETDEQVQKLGMDVLLYFGLAEHSISKIFIPNDLKPDRIVNNWQVYSYLGDHDKYRNNYDYHKSIYLVNRIPFYDNGFVMLKEDKANISPTGVVYFEYYDNQEQLQHRIRKMEEAISCVVSETNSYENALPIGKSHFPRWDQWRLGYKLLEFLLEQAKA
ncbi:MAG: hypothetical protein K9I94_04790 [Bacteroidales bacterium]|nr:hypothetical protein [Bacteroidales bacterium]